MCVFCDWFISLSIMSSRFVHIVGCDKSPSFLRLNNTFIFIISSAEIIQYICVKGRHRGFCKCAVSVSLLFIQPWLMYDQDFWERCGSRPSPFLSASLLATRVGQERSLLGVLGQGECCPPLRCLLFPLGTLLTAHSPTPVAPHPVTVPTYRAPGTPTYSYVPPQWWSPCKRKWPVKPRPSFVTKVHSFKVENGKSMTI